MQTREFIERVETGCTSLDPARSHEACIVTVRALCEYLSYEQARRMASQLPDELAHAAEDAGKAPRAAGAMVSLDAFYEKLEIRAEVNHDTAEQLARAVAHTLTDALSDSEAVAVTFDLPSELNVLRATQM